MSLLQTLEQVAENKGNWSLKMPRPCATSSVFHILSMRANMSTTNRNLVSYPGFKTVQTKSPDEPQYEPRRPIMIYAPHVERWPHQESLFQRNAFQNSNFKIRYNRKCKTESDQQWREEV